MKSRNRRTVAAVVAVAHLALLSSQAWAQTARDQVAVAREHFSRGVKMYQEDDFRGALIEFKRAYELSPNWAVLYNVGQAEYQLRDYAAALRTLEGYVREGDAQIAAERRAQVEREIVELRGRVAHVTVVANVDGVDVGVDDAPLGKASATEVLLVGAGRHRLSASRPGYVAASKTVDIAGGDTLTVRFDLVPEASRLAPPPRESPSYALAVLAGVIGVGGIATGTVFGVLTMNGKAALDGECGRAKVCPPSAQTDLDAYARNGTIAGVAFGVGAVGSILGTYSFFHERSKEAPTQAGLTPWIAPTGAGVSGSF